MYPHKPESTGDVPAGALVQDLADYDGGSGSTSPPAQPPRSAASRWCSDAGAPKDTIKQIEYYATALKAPRIRDSAARLAEQARDAGWTHEEYLSAVLSREMASRES